MRILTRDRVMFTGQRLCPEFDCPPGPLPADLQILLCLLDGADRRRQLQGTINREPNAQISAKLLPSA